ncbi:hypothetical protein BDR04DRAFT_1103184 [Suillus decipiens]|nr:hypothetical protein BDR04DRAFT_1103184 [Suillus decipiens]
MPVLFYMLLTGSFFIKNKDDLIDIAGALQISTAGTKPELLKAIKEYFESHPELKTGERFAGLFTGRSRTGQKRSFNEGPSDETVQNVPSATRPRLDISHSNSSLHAGPSSCNTLPSIQFQRTLFFSLLDHR